MGTYNPLDSVFFYSGMVSIHIPSTTEISYLPKEITTRFSIHPVSEGLAHYLHELIDEFRVLLILNIINAANFGYTYYTQNVRL